MLPSAEDLSGRLEALALAPWTKALTPALAEALAPGRHGDRPRWEAALEQLPELPEVTADLTGPAPRLACPRPLSPKEQAALKGGLEGLRPWRKGPLISLASPSMRNGAPIGNGTDSPRTLIPPASASSTSAAETATTRAASSARAPPPWLALIPRYSLAAKAQPLTATPWTPMAASPHCL